MNFVFVTTMGSVWGLLILRNITFLHSYETVVLLLSFIYRLNHEKLLTYLNVLVALCYLFLPISNDINSKDSFQVAFKDALKSKQRLTHISVLCCDKFILYLPVKCSGKCTGNIFRKYMFLSMFLGEKDIKYHMYHKFP